MSNLSWAYGLFSLMLMWLFGSTLASHEIIPTPYQVINVIGESWRDHFNLAVTTSLEAFFGLMLASLCALFIVAAIGIFPRFEGAVYPLLLMLKASPAVAFVPIFICLVGSGFICKVLVSSMISFFPLVVGGADGIKKTPEKLRTLATSYGANSWKYFKEVSWSYGLSGFLSGMKTAAPLSVVGAIVGEYVAGGSPRGIGTYIMVNVVLYHPPEMFAGAIISAVIGLVYFSMVVVFSLLVEKRFNHAK